MIEELVIDELAIYEYVKSLVLLNQGSNPQDPNPPISQNGRRTLFSFGHPVEYEKGYAKEKFCVPSASQVFNRLVTSRTNRNSAIQV